MSSKSGCDDLCAAAVLQGKQNALTQLRGSAVSWLISLLLRICYDGQHSKELMSCVRLTLRTEALYYTAGAEEATKDAFKVVEVDAFSSVHDMIHAAIESYGQNATLRQVYSACVERGRIAYKRAGGSRLITNNDHWKSQIRHALYTCDRFKRAAENNDLWQISPAWKSTKPQTVKVLIRTDLEGSVSNESAQDTSRPVCTSGRQKCRARATPDPDPPFPAGLHRKKRSSLAKRAREERMRPDVSQERSASPTTASSAQVDECSRVDTLSPLQPCYSPMTAGSPCHIAHPGLMSHYLEHWQRAAMALNAQTFSLSCDNRATFTRLGSEAVTGPFSARDGSAEAESPALCKPLYALRSHTKPPAPPGFGDNPDPVAERAAREAHATTSGPLKKRLKAAAKAAEMAANATATTGETNSEVTNLSSEQTRMTAIWATPPPRPREAGEEQGRRTLWRPRASTPPSYLSSLVTRRGGKDVSASPSPRGAQFLHGSPLSRYNSFRSESGFQPIPATLPLLHGHHPPQPAVSYAPCMLAQVVAGQLLGVEATEGGDETDEAGGKRLLRSDAAAAAADLRKGGSFDRTR